MTKAIKALTYCGALIFCIGAMAVCLFAFAGIMEGDIVIHEMRTAPPIFRTMRNFMAALTGFMSAVYFLFSSLLIWHARKLTG